MAKKIDDLPVTKKFLDLKLQEVSSHMTTFRLEMNSKFASLDTKFASIDEKFSRIEFLLQEMRTQSTKALVTIEEQNDRNKVVMDGLMSTYENLQETNKRIDRLEIRTFGQSN